MTERKMRSLTRSVLIGFFASIFLAGMVLLLTNANQSIAFQFNLRPGNAASPEFRVHADGSYLVELEVERTLPFEQLNCLLGISPSNAQGCELPTVVDINWRVTSQHDVIAEGSSRERASGFWGERIGRTLGTFPAKRGREYVLHVETMKDASALAVTNPRLAVRMHPFREKSRTIIGKLLLVISTAATLGAVLWFSSRGPFRREDRGHP